MGRVRQAAGRGHRGPAVLWKDGQLGAAVLLVAFPKQAQPSRSPEALGRLGPSLQDVRSWGKVGAGRQMGLQLRAATKTAMKEPVNRSHPRRSGRPEAGP